MSTEVRDRRPEKLWLVFAWNDSYPRWDCHEFDTEAEAIAGLVDLEGDHKFAARRAEVSQSLILPVMA